MARPVVPPATAEPSDAGVAAPTSWIARAWSSPLWAHAAALAAVLLVVLAVSRPSATYATDEGAAIIQAQVLERTGHWILPVPTHVLDPRNQAQPIPNGDHGPNGRAPYAKHPLYPLVLLGAFKLAGNLGYFLVSVLGTWSAAVGAALLARRIRPESDRLGLWAVGLGSPLFFDSTWVLAHSLAAAGASAAALLTVVACDRAASGPRATSGLDGRNVALLIGAALAVALTAAVRTEGVILGIAMAMAAAVWALVRRRWLGVAAAVTSLAAVGVVRLGERLASEAILGTGSAVQGVPSSASSSSAPPPGSWAGARVEAVAKTMLRPSYSGGAPVGVLVIGAILLLAAGGLARFRRPPREVLIAGGLAAVLYLLWLVEGDRDAIPGLLIACPLIGAAVACADRRTLQSGAGLLLSLTATAAVAGVVLTEYYYGGGLEWGGRFFAFILPVAAAPLAAAVWGLERPQRRALIVGLVSTGLVTAALVVVSVRHVHDGAAADEKAVAICARIAGPPGSTVLDSRPLVVTSWNLFPQGIWRTFLHYQWLAPNSTELDRYAARAASRGVRRLVLVSQHPAAELPVPGFTEVVACPAHQLTVAVLRRTA